VTKEQIIVLGVIAAAFVAGWIVHALTGRGDRSKQPAEPAVDGRLEHAVELSRLELDRAVRTYVASLLLSESAEGAPGQLGRLTRDVSSALRDDAANDCMLSVVPDDHETALSDRELDLTDWGFAYGVAWARARERDPALPEEAIAREALQAAEAVFRDYTAGEAAWGRRNGEAG
jgi:uncharacterized membrane protein YdfJ with MMPL/SSD domain